jgi:hypothetical protein
MADASRTPPWLRSARPGKISQRVQVGPQRPGFSKSNSACPPLSVTNGKGERLFFKNRGVKVSAPSVTFED